MIRISRYYSDVYVLIDALNKYFDSQEEVITLLQNLINETDRGNSDLHKELIEQTKEYAKENNRCWCCNVKLETEPWEEYYGTVIYEVLSKTKCPNCGNEY